MNIDQKPVKNATRPVTIHVLDQDVKKGSVKEPSACAMALAAMRDVPHCTRARVHVSTSYLEVGEKWLRFRTPRAVRDEIISFDRGTGFHAGEYTLIPIQPSHRATGKRMGGGTRKVVAKAKPKIAKRIRHTITGIRRNADTH